MHMVMQSFRHHVPVPAQLPPAVLSALSGQPPMGQQPMLLMDRQTLVLMGGPPPMGAPAEDWALPPNAAARNASAFQKACQECGQPTLGKAESQLNTWELSTDVLLHLWAIADTDGDDRLDLREYLIICHLAKRCCSFPTLPPPTTLPPELLAAAGAAVKGFVQGGCCAPDELGAQDGPAAPGGFATPDGFAVGFAAQGEPGAFISFRGCFVAIRRAFCRYRQGRRG